MKFFFKNFLLIAVFFLSFSFFQLVFAANLKFDKTTVSVSSGQTFTTSVNLDPSGDNIFSTDIYINYDPSFLKATAVSSGSLFPTVSNDISTSGKVYIAAMVNDPGSPVSSAGAVATITFQGLKDGTTNISFDCSSSKIIKNDMNGTNVLNCSESNTAQITIGTGGTSTSSDLTTANNNPVEELPKTGILENMIKFAIPGVILLILGGALRIGLN